MFFFAECGGCRAVWMRAVKISLQQGRFGHGPVRTILPRGTFSRHFFQSLSLGVHLILCNNVSHNFSPLPAVLPILPTSSATFDFDIIPATIRLPFFHPHFDNSDMNVHTQLFRRVHLCHYPTAFRPLGSPWHAMTGEKRKPKQMDFEGKIKPATSLYLYMPR